MGSARATARAWPWRARASDPRRTGRASSEPWTARASEPRRTGRASWERIFLALIEEYKAGDASDVRRDLAALSANVNGGLRATQLRLKVLANQHRIATGMELSSAEVRDYALDALDPGKGRAPAALADTHARQVELADDGSS